MDEELGYVPKLVFKDITGRFPKYPKGEVVREPANPDWDFNFDDASEMQKRLPKLWARFGN